VSLATYNLNPVGADVLNIPYPVTLVRGENDEVEWSATIEALPNCHGRGATPAEALARVAAAMEALLDAAREEGREMPDPKSQQSYSGRLLLRMPQSLHADLARAAERERVSLNQFISDALSGALGWRSATRGSLRRGTRAVPTEGLDEPELLQDSERRGRTRFATAIFFANFVIVALVAVVAIVVLVVALR
jgi:antitoxin HicB